MKNIFLVICALAIVWIGFSWIEIIFTNTTDITKDYSNLNFFILFLKNFF